MSRSTPTFLQSIQLHLPGSGQRVVGVGVGTAVVETRRCLAYVAHDVDARVGTRAGSLPVWPVVACPTKALWASHGIGISGTSRMAEPGLASESRVSCSFRAKVA
jgi:hypothetical protein